MNHHVNVIAGRLSLRPPQRDSLKILDRITEIAPPKKGADAAGALAAIRSEFPTATDFERDFPSLCFALATGVGKTRLMGAFISYLHLARGINNFFVLAPNLTIYNKLITDFTPNTSKYVFKGIAEFATDQPELITGDNYETKAGSLFDIFTRCKVNIFNISKINSEVRGGKSPRIKRLSEYIGESYFDYLAGLPDLVLLMDDSHRYRAGAGIRAINELKPVLGLELTATPFVGTTTQNRQYFRNVVYGYPLGQAMADGFVKEPAVVTRKNFNPAGMSPEEIEQMNLEDGVCLHESVKVELETYARATDKPIVKPFVKDSVIHLAQVELDDDQLDQKTVTVVSQSRLANMLGLQPAHMTHSTKLAGSDEPHMFSKPEEQKAAQLALAVICRFENQPTIVPTLAHLKNPDVQAAIVKAVQEQHRPTQMDLEGVTEQPDFAAVVAKTVALVTQQTIDIPRILVVPKDKIGGEVKAGFKPFTLELGSLKYPAVSNELWIQHLRTNQLEVLALGRGGIEEARLEDYIVGGLVDFDDISYDDHADLLYDLASQTVQHFRSYLTEDDTRKILRCYQREVAKFIHAQMQQHYWEEEVDYEVVVSKGFTELKPSAYAASAAEPPLDFRQSPADKSNMAKYLFGGFTRCLYSVGKFHSEAERILAVILDREAKKWFKPAQGQVQISYKSGADHHEYQPDFVAESKDVIYMLEPKAGNQMEDAIVQAKQSAAIKWCQNASDYALANGGKPWRYVLIPHTAIAVNMTLERLVARNGP